jgi:hypothetical protein
MHTSAAGIWIGVLDALGDALDVLLMPVEGLCLPDREAVDDFEPDSLARSSLSRDMGISESLVGVSTGCPTRLLEGAASSQMSQVSRCRSRSRSRSRVVGLSITTTTKIAVQLARAMI